MPHCTNVCPRVPLTKDKFQELLRQGWSRISSVAGMTQMHMAAKMGLHDPKTISRALSGQNVPEAHTIFNSLLVDTSALDEIAKALGLKLVPEEATCDIDDLGVTMAKALVKLNEAKHPDSPGGRSITHSEFLDAEAIMRDVHKASGHWLEVCAEIRRPRSVA